VGGTYDRFAKAFAPRLEQVLGVRVEIVNTAGASENRERLLRGDLDLALMEFGSESMAGISAVAPIYDELFFLIVRAGSDITDPGELSKRRIAVGESGSGNQIEATRILSFFGAPRDAPNLVSIHFTALETDATIEGAVEVTGMLNPKLNTLMEANRFRLLPIHEAEALALRLPYLAPGTVPRGLFGGNPVIPHEPVPTVGLKTFLAARTKASPRIVNGCLAALYQTDLRFAFPTLIFPEAARQWIAPRWHTTSEAFFRPVGDIDFISNLLQGADAIKELIIAFGAALYLLWSRWQTIKQRAERRLLAQLKERLDGFLRQTMEIEKIQMADASADQLKSWLDEITSVKLQALDELTHDDLRGDRNFSIFLQQCSIVSDKIQRQLLRKGRDQQIRDELLISRSEH